MSSFQNSLVPMKNLLIIFILYSYVYISYSLDITDEIKDVLNFKNLTTLKKFVGLPNDFELTEEEISKNEAIYSANQQNEDINLNGTQLIQKYGYEVEDHCVITSDGYHLGMYRIPGNGRAVFLMHGLASSFVDWLTIGPDRALPYLLANEGYDVWMGNTRGTTYSREHDHLSSSDPEYWKFSFDEIGSIDVATMIDYVLEKTGKQKLTYIGHSQGTTSFFVLCSTKPEYNDKIDFMIALSAIAWMQHVTSPIAKIISPVLITLPASGPMSSNVFPQKLTKPVMRVFCGNSFLAALICQNVVFSMFGFNYAQMDYEQLPVIYSHCPSPSSLMQFVHYTQLIISGYFRNYDYGPIVNLRKYGSLTPPSYPLDKITVPISIFRGPGDWMTSTTDINKLCSNLKTVIDYYEIPLSSFNHFDFLWAKDVKSLVYDRILTLMKKY